jgi:hypothetical protein
MVLQTANAIPQSPAGRQVIGRTYVIRSSAILSQFKRGSISFQYLGMDVLLSGLPEKNLAVYYLPDSGFWQWLETRLNQNQNFASAPMPGPGLYALMSSLDIPLYGPSWNVVSYPLHESRPVLQALLAAPDRARAGGARGPTGGQ